jgi:hypothetical protein
MNRESRRTVTAVGVTVVAYLSCATASMTASPGGSISYEDNARTFRETFAKNETIGVKILPKRPLPSQSRDVMFGESLTNATHDCSTERFRCVYYWARVFAVPRDRLSPAAVYSTGGASLKVEDCLRGGAAVCQVAVISADCQRIAGKDACEKVVGGRDKSDDPGPIVYFIYNEDVGVTAWGVAKQPASTKEERSAIASQMVLQGKRGLLFASP